ncbi:branched-chain amino acid ABC transporter permease [Chelativorans composti]
MERMVNARQLVTLLVVFALIATCPFWVKSAPTMNTIIAVLYIVLLGQAWNILGGYGGQFSFGHAAFFGTGAYTVAVLQIQFGINPWIGLLAGALLATAVALIVGFASFRYGLRGSYFALVTLAFAEVLRILSNSVSFTGGGVGLLLQLDRRFSNLQFADNRGYFWVVWAMCLACFLCVWWIGRSRFGAWLMAVRDNEDAARALGVDVFRTKMGAAALSGFFTGLAGVFYAQFYLYLDPSIAYGSAVSIEALLVPIIGGMGTLFGPLIGAGVIHFLSEMTRHFVGDVPGVALAIYGALLIVIVMFLPRGLISIDSVIRGGTSGRRRANA